MFDVREGTSDQAVIDEVWSENVYRLEPEDLEGRTVVDLGANIGAFSIFAAVAGAAVVHAYEPGAANASALVGNLERNGLGHSAFVWTEAVWSEAGEVAFHAGPQGAEASSSTDDWIEDGDVPVPAVILDTVVDRVDHVDVLKIDTEGAEAAIILGASERAWGRIDRIVMEFHGSGTGAALHEGEWMEMVEVLAEHGHVEILGRPSRGGMIWWYRYS